MRPEGSASLAIMPIAQSPTSKHRGAKKKVKRSKRHNTHHHYHIDVNFQQINNILVSYGGTAHAQKFKSKREASKAHNTKIHTDQTVQGENMNSMNFESQRKSIGPQSPHRKQPVAVGNKL